MQKKDAVKMSDVPGNAEGLVGGVLVEACDLPWVTRPQLDILFLRNP